MANQAGTILGVSELRAKTFNATTNRKAYHVSLSFPQGGGADTASVAAVGATIAARTRNGKTVTLRGAVPMAAAQDSAGLDVYFTGTAVQALTVSTDSLTGQLSTAAGAVTATASAVVGCELCVIVDEV